jgi:predicted HTH domain antitoxin
MISKVELPKEFALLCNIDEKEIPGYIRKLIALELFREKKISLGKASEIAGLSVDEMMILLKEREINLNYSVEDLEKDLEIIEETHK